MYDGTQSDIGLKVIVVSICYELLFSFSSISIYYGFHLDIRVKSYCRWICSSFCFQFRAPRYITRLYRISELKVIVVGIWYELLFSITGVSIYYGTQSNFWVKIYCILNFQRAFVFNYERLDILWKWIGHPSKNLLSLEFATSFRFQLRASRYTMGHIGHPRKKLLSFELAQKFNIQFRASRYITGLNQTSE